MALIAVWALGFMQFVGTGGFSGALGRLDRDEAIELVSPHGPVPGALPAASTAAPREPAKGAAPAMEAGQPIDLIAAQAQVVRERYRLSARETEVMELIARGHSVARIAEALVVSENTIRTHSKRIYAKLDIHKKQELVDLLESVGEP